MDRIKRGLKKIKDKLIVAALLLLVLIVICIAPFSIALKDALETGQFNLTIFWNSISSQMAHPFNSVGKVLSFKYIGTFLSTLWKFILVYIVALAVGLYKAMPKNEYTDIEHGSSDWSQNGEQYKVLSKTKGILLAQKNYLPVDKRGNVNVLVVGRFWFW